MDLEQFVAPVVMVLLRQRQNMLKMLEDSFVNKNIMYREMIVMYVVVLLYLFKTLMAVCTSSG
jgi:hypothetical protein